MPAPFLEEKVLGEHTVQISLPNQGLAMCLSNRAACYTKLGAHWKDEDPARMAQYQHRAKADLEAAVQACPDYINGHR